MFAARLRSTGIRKMLEHGAGRAVELTRSDDVLLESLHEGRCEHGIADQAGQQLAASGNGEFGPLEQEPARPGTAGEQSRRP